MAVHPQTELRSEPRRKIDATFRAMGTYFELLLYHADERVLRALVNEIQEEVARLENKLSRFIPTSEVSRINRLAGRQEVLVDYEMLEILQLALDGYRKTGGAFDITVAPLVREWGFYTRTPNVADVARLRELLERVGSDKILLDPERRTIRFQREGMEIDFGAMGKGFALREVVRIVRDAGVSMGLLSFGGSSIYALGDMPGRTGWTFGFRYDENPQVPPGQVTLRDEAFSMSGITARRFVQDGKVYGHVLSPRSGEPVQEVQGVAVVHPDPVTAEILSTALMVLGPEQGSELIRQEGARATFAVRTPEGCVLREIKASEV